MNILHLIKIQSVYKAYYYNKNIKMLYEEKLWGKVNELHLRYER